MRSILRNESGNIAILFGLALVPLIGLAGGAVDFAHRANVRADLQTSADAAALAVARSLQSSQLLPGDEGWEEAKANAITLGNSMFDADFSVAGIEGRPEFIIDGTHVRVDASVGIKTSFLGIIGIETLAADAAAEVGIPDPISVEMVFVLDYSKSMEESDKYVRMSNAVRGFIDKVGTERGARTKIGIVPFSEFVLADVRGRDVRGTPTADQNVAMRNCLSNRDYPYSASNGTPVFAQDGKPLARHGDQRNEMCGLCGGRARDPRPERRLRRGSHRQSTRCDRSASPTYPWRRKWAGTCFPPTSHSRTQRRRRSRDR